MQLTVTGYGRLDASGWRGGIRVPHPRTGATLTLDLVVPRDYAADFSRVFADLSRRAVEGEFDDGVAGEVGFLGALGRLAGQLAPQLLPGLIQGATQALGGLFGGGAPRQAAPRPAQPPPAAPRPAVPPLPGLAGLLGAGGVAPDLLGSATVLAAAPSFAAISPALQRTLTTAIRVVDAEAASRIGDPRAREALRRARQSAEERVVRALRLVDAMLDRP